MATLKEQIEERTRLQHRLAVWEAIHSLMSEQFLTKDGRSTCTAIQVSDCPVGLVPEDTVEDVLQNIAEGPIAEIRSLLEQLESQEVVVYNDVKVKA